VFDGEKYRTGIVEFWGSDITEMVPFECWYQTATPVFTSFIYDGFVSMECGTNNSVVGLSIN
jgi:hypothetical protein